MPGRRDQPAARDELCRPRADKRDSHEPPARGTVRRPSTRRRQHLDLEGHDQPKTGENPNPKALDQVLVTPLGTQTQNGRFYDAAVNHRERKTPAERVRVYEKIRSGIWVHNGTFELLDGWAEQINGRRVFQFRLKLTSDDAPQQEGEAPEIEQQRVIPTAVKLAVWKRDSGRCTQCGATDNLHFDHIIPYSRGGSSLVAQNVQLLCARHNLSKHASIR